MDSWDLLDENTLKEIPHKPFEGAKWQHEYMEKIHPPTIWKRITESESNEFKLKEK